MNYWTSAGSTARSGAGHCIRLQIVSRSLPNDSKQTHSDIPWGSAQNWTGGPSHAVPSQSATAINFNTPSFSSSFRFSPSRGSNQPNRLRTWTDINKETFTRKEPNCQIDFFLFELLQATIKLLF
jgi:hypothetical protein